MRYAARDCSSSFRLPIRSHDAERAAPEVADYRQAILRVARTSLREMIGASPLSSLLSERKAADLQLKDEIGHKDGNRCRRLAV